MERVRIGIVGTGQRVCHHSGCVFAAGGEDVGCERDIVLAAMCDPRPDRLAEAKRVYEARFGHEIATYGNYEAMYDEADLDGVYVAGPNWLHGDMSTAALERGLHVLCEKPMDTTLPKCDAMIAAAQKADRLLAFAMQMHYRRRYHMVKELIDSGRIGQPTMLWCTEHRKPFRTMKDWVWQRSKSGGAIVEKNCHHYDILDLWVASAPTTVYASGSIVKHIAPDGAPSEIIDNAWVVNDYACGARALVGISFLADERQGHTREFGVIGTEGRVTFSLADGEALHIEHAGGRRETVTSNEVLRGGVFRDFVDCIRTGGEPLVGPERARRSLLVPLAAERSLEEKRIVHVSELE